MGLGDQNLFFLSEFHLDDGFANEWAYIFHIRQVILERPTFAEASVFPSISPSSPVYFSFSFSLHCHFRGNTTFPLSPLSHNHIQEGEPLVSTTGGLTFLIPCRRYCPPWSVKSVSVILTSLHSSAETNSWKIEKESENLNCDGAIKSAGFF